MLAKIVPIVPPRPDLLHIPRLDTVLMVEDVIQRYRELPSRAELIRRLPRKVMYPTLNLILLYLQYSKKIAVTDEGRILWVFQNNRKLKRETTRRKKTRLGGRLLPE
jgi:hypothetical protein